MRHTSVKNIVMLNRLSYLLAGLLVATGSYSQPTGIVTCGCANCRSSKNLCGCAPNEAGTNQLVQLSGEILQVEATTNRSSIYVLCNGRICQAVLHASLPESLTPRLRQETPAQLTGMLIKTPDERNQPSEWKLLLRSSDDIQLGKRPLLTRTQRASLFTFSALLGSLCFAIALFFLIRWWRQRKKAYAMELILAERKRIAADFHDTIEQGLATASLILKATLERENTANSRGIQLALHALATTQNAARAAVWNLQPEALRDRSLSEALQEIVDAIDVSGKIRVSCDLAALPAQLPERLATGLYAIVREACANVVKHSQATELTLAATAHAQGLTLTLADNGIGFDPARANDPGQSHFGLASMRERAQRLNLNLTITSTPATGTTLQIVLPHEVLT